MPESIQRLIHAGSIQKLITGKVSILNSHLEHDLSPQQACQKVQMMAFAALQESGIQEGKIESLEKYIHIISMK